MAKKKSGGKGWVMTPARKAAYAARKKRTSTLGPEQRRNLTKINKQIRAAKSQKHTRKEIGQMFKSVYKHHRAKVPRGWVCLNPVHDKMRLLLLLSTGKVLKRKNWLRSTITPQTEKKEQRKNRRRQQPREYGDGIVVRRDKRHLKIF